MPQGGDAESLSGYALVDINIRRLAMQFLIAVLLLLLAKTSYGHQWHRMRSAAASRWLLLTLLCIIASTHAQTVMTLPGGRIYQGDLEDGEPYGVGTMVYPNGTHYQGEFVAGYREGRGTAIFYDASRYEGEWRNDIPHGRGVYQWPSGERYEGDVVENRRSGRGVMTFRDGTFYDGEWRDDTMNGQG